MDIDQLRYPIGKYQAPQPITAAHIKEWTEDVAAFPQTLRAGVQGMSESQLATSYREEGWTVRQTVNHVADSHMNAYMRFKLALTEENPTIKPYMEDRWAELEDGRNASVDGSLELIASLHKRWVVLLKSMEPSDFQRTFFHPQRKTTVSLESTLGLYAWHGKHHLAHIQNLKERMKW
jgi:hypothetical protein